ncbi:MAG: DTDP-4-dehydrorhamnose reductase [Microgenomates group bacterium Gr01-1014_7]|nr:MAG: DTDP-4-dehydrorhamnose reductase [Microgenomates group bacterium Gr01-1014_7]
MNKRQVLIFGGSGLVGSKFLELNAGRFNISSPPASLVDITDFNQASKFIEDSGAEVIINFAAFTHVEESEKQKNDKRGLAYMLNAAGAKNVADACKILEKHLIHISTEYIFDGTKSGSPYIEEDKPNPINWYGQTKYFGEQNVLESGCSYIIVRLSMPYSAYYQQKSDIARFFLNQLREKKQIKAIINQRITPTLTDDIANALAVLVEGKASGIYHVSSINHTTPFEFAKQIVQAFNLDSSLIVSMTLGEYNQKKMAKLLKNSWLDSAKFTGEFGQGILHSVEESIKLFKEEVDGKG